MSIRGFGSAWPITRLIDGKAQPQRPLHLVDLLVHVGTLRAPDRPWQWKLTISPPSAFAHAHVVHVADEVDLRGDVDQGVAHRGDPFRAARRGRLDRCGCSGSIWVSTSTSGPSSSRIACFEPVGDLVRARERRARRRPRGRARPTAARRSLHRDVMDGERAVARDHHDALEHGLVVERARLGVDGHLGRRDCRRAPRASIRSLIAATRSSGSVRLTATTRSTNSTSPDRPHAHAARARQRRGCAPRSPRSCRRRPPARYR